MDVQEQIEPKDSTKILIALPSTQGYPYTRERIVREARIDIPPLLRGKIWAALLGVRVSLRSSVDTAGIRI